MEQFSPFRPFSASSKAYSSPTDSFPLDSLPAPIAEYAAIVAENITVSPDMPAALSLAVLSAALQGKAKVRYSASYIQEINVYICIVADPAERKSPVFRAMTTPLNIYVTRYNTENERKIEDFAYTKSALENKRASAIAKGKSEDIKRINDEITALEPFYPMRVLVTDTTVEALADALAQNSERLAILSDEGGIFDIAAGQYSNGKANINLYLNAYDGERVIIDRKYGVTNLSRPLLTFGVMAQHQILNQIMENPIFRGRGFVQRFMLCQPPSCLGKAKITRSKARDAEFQKVQNVYNQLIYRLMELPIADENTYIEIDDSAAQLFEEFSNTLEINLGKGGECEDTRDFFGKYGGRILRIAGLLHLAEGNKMTVPISAPIMRNSVNIVRYFYNQAMSILNSEERDIRQAALLFEKMKLFSEKSSSADKRVSWRDIRQKMRNWTDTQTENALEVLIERGYIAELTPPKERYKGASKPSYILNPIALHNYKKGE